MTIRNYRDLIAWQKAMDLALAVYASTKALPTEEKFGLSSQMRRAAVSIAANIAEGQGRFTDGEFGNQLSVAHGSTRELETHVMLSERLQFLPPEAAAHLLEMCSEVGRLVAGLSKSLKR